MFSFVRILLCYKGYRAGGGCAVAPSTNSIALTATGKSSYAMARTERFESLSGLSGS
jgi:hypothetical protein